MEQNQVYVVDKLRHAACPILDYGRQLYLWLVQFEYASRIHVNEVSETSHGIKGWKRFLCTFILQEYQYNKNTMNIDLHTYIHT